MTHLKSRSDRFIDRLGQWLEGHLPAWLYQEITLQPDRALRPDDYKAAKAVCWILIAAAGLFLVISLSSLPHNLIPMP